MLTLFASDLHLSAHRPETTELFLRFLAGPAREADALYLLGDLFDYWIGDDDLDDPLSDPLGRRVCDALASLPGTRFFLPGNRDFLIGAAFSAASGCALLADEIVIDLAGTPTVLLHGDTLCTDDAAYQAFRATTRSPAWQREFLTLPLAERRKQAEALREQSETEKRTKSYDLMDANADAIARTFRRHGVTRMIHGHTHRQARHEHLVDGRVRERWVLGDWDGRDNRANALAIDDRGGRWLSIAP